MRQIRMAEAPPSQYRTVNDFGIPIAIGYGVGIILALCQRSGACEVRLTEVIGGVIKVAFSNFDMVPVYLSGAIQPVCYNLFG